MNMSAEHWDILRLREYTQRGMRKIVKAIEMKRNPVKC